jgi:hypothetical protein
METTLLRSVSIKLEQSEHDRLKSLADSRRTGR